VKLQGEASTTAGDCYKMRFSRRRARCVADAPEDLGIPAAALDVGWIGDRDSKARLAAKPVKTQRDIENPDDRRVRISSTSFGLSGLTWTHYDMATTGALANSLALNFGMLPLLGNHPGIITQLAAGSTPLYARGQVVKAARFAGLTFGAGKTLEPVVTIFDMQVDDVITLPGRIDVRFTVLSEPCTHRWGTEGVPFRLNSASCKESIKQEGSYTISNDLLVSGDNNQVMTT
jgi:hypothetical protein